MGCGAPLAPTGADRCLRGLRNGAGRQLTSTGRLEDAFDESSDDERATVNFNLGVLSGIDQSLFGYVSPGRTSSGCEHLGLA